LKQLKGQCLGIVRVYSELIEHKDFPLPGEPIPPRRRTDAYENSVTKAHKDIALHHIIRHNNTDEAKQILVFDKRFRDQPEKVTEKEIEEYQKLVTTCKVEVLKKSPIIICTCTASASYVMKMTKDGPEPACNINQVCDVSSSSPLNQRSWILLCHDSLVLEIPLLSPHGSGRALSL
jgi:hypothetical protein